MKQARYLVICELLGGFNSILICLINLAKSCNKFFFEERRESKNPFVGDNTVCSGGLEGFSKVAMLVDFDTAENILGPGDAVSEQTLPLQISVSRAYQAILP